jgi:hypothetical protein
MAQKRRDAVIKKKLRRSTVMTFLALSLLLMVVFGLAPLSAAQLGQPFPIVIVPGPPDLTVQISAVPNSIYGGPNPNGVNESSLVTITVQNRLTAPQEPQLFEGTLRLFGSEARGVSISVSMPASLSQVGNMGIPSGFQCAVAPDNHHVFCWGGTIPAGGSVAFQVEIIGAYGCGYRANIQAVADPYNWIAEASETNNDASSEIFVYSIC